MCSNSQSITFTQKLATRANRLMTRLCVGLDPDIQKIVAATGSDDVFAFNQKIIDVTADIALCYKPQIAHYSALGIEQQLIDTIAYIHHHYPDIPVILDAKRSDIGSTASYYAMEAFDRYQADAVTVNPYLGYDSIAPFLKFTKKGVIVLAKTSNPSAATVQDIAIAGKPFYAHLAQQLVIHFADNEQLLFVVGATDTAALRQMRQLFANRWFLVPGIGTQGGTVTEAIQNGGDQLIINVTRTILYPSIVSHHHFTAVKEQALAIHHDIQQAIAAIKKIHDKA